MGPKHEVIPQNIITKAPTAELRDNQTDQDSLPEYDVLDDILFKLIEEEISVKDIIKSGGEWISSIDLENAAVGHPEIVEAAALGVTHPKWDERPILVVVTKENSNISKEQIFKFMESYVAKWQIPDDIIFVDQIPHTATGKISKIDLRKVLENKQYTHPDLK